MINLRLVPGEIEPPPRLKPAYEMNDSTDKNPISIPIKLESKIQSLKKIRNTPLGELAIWN
jgi:hypothetical protein